MTCCASASGLEWPLPRNVGVKFGRQLGVRVKADRYQARVLKLREEGCSYRQIARDLGLSKNTVMEIVHRHR